MEESTGGRGKIKIGGEMMNVYDVIVIGAGHAGCEAALAAARMGCDTLVLTMKLDHIALMPCNPSIGGPAKGHLAREVDALGGEMGRNTDKTFIQIRMLNTGRGPAVQALRAQSDKGLYASEMRKTLERQEGLTIREALVTGVRPGGGDGPRLGGRDDGGEWGNRGAGASSRFLAGPRNDMRDGGRDSGEGGERECAGASPGFLAGPRIDMGEGPRNGMREGGGSDGMGVVMRLETKSGQDYLGKTVILTTGTSLAGKIIMGDRAYTGGRAGEPAATEISMSLRKLGFKLGRHKTGTPPRLDARSINFEKARIQPGSPTPLHFSFWGCDDESLSFPSPNPVYPRGPVSGWRPQMACYLVNTNPKTHAVITANLDRAPMFNGSIKGVGPRYCPSIEDKVVRFAHKDSHGLFLEPEGWETNEVYLQGANTSLPEDVQEAFVRSIAGLERAKILKPGYAIEYDFVLTDQINATMESKLVPNLFLAGQVCGTSGYEEAAGQGIVAGINAALKVKGRTPLILRRDQAYLGVMIDDLVTRDHFEPYRMLTSRAEHRLLLRQDNADQRLAPIGYEVGLLSADQYGTVEEKRERVARELGRLGGTYLPQDGRMDTYLESRGLAPVRKAVTTLEFLRRPEVDYDTALALGLGDRELDEECRSQVEVEAKYRDYIARQSREVERIRKLEQRPIPSGVDYTEVRGLSNEAWENLSKFLPLTVGQASRVPGVGTSDLSLLLVHLERRRDRARAV